ncbi:MAG TPA: CsbD family protein [Terriglobales bacterium]|nr:CsbD family protein [Terriglobales bacterium]
MDKDRVKGEAKDVAGRIQRQAGEWTGDEETQAEGAAKQAEGKVQNAWGNLKDAAKKTADDAEAEAKRREQEKKDENAA